MVASQSRTSPEFSEGSLGGVEVAKGITTRDNVHDQPRGLSFLKLLTLPAQLAYNVAFSEGGDARQLVSHPRYHHRKSLIPGVSLAPMVTMVDTRG